MSNILHDKDIHRNGLSVSRTRVDANCRIWLTANGYSDVTAKITKIERSWKKRGVKTRKDWWLILAGTKDGKPRSVEGVAFPILASCRERQGYPPCEGELARGENEALAPRPRAQKRWGKRWRRAM